MSDIQRARLLAAMGQVACEHGAAHVTVAHVVERAGVSRRTFYELFTSAEDCLLATLDGARASACERVLPAWRAHGSWRERMRGALTALLSLFDERPVLARLLVVESLTAGRAGLERRARVLDRLIDAIREGATVACDRRAGADHSRVMAEGVAGGALAIVHARISDGQPGRMVELLNPLMSMIVLPYLGSAAARRELGRSLPAAPPSERSDGSPLRSDPFKDAGMRLTYRTMRVLAAIAERAGASNRQIGERAGITDQGQVSKLLARLERLGLIANEGEGQSRGEPNAWTLTPAGQQVMANIRLHTPEGMIQ